MDTDLEDDMPLHPCCVKDREEATEKARVEALHYENDFVRKRFEERRGILGGRAVASTAVACSIAQCPGGCGEEHWRMPGLPLALEEDDAASRDEDDAVVADVDAGEESEDFDDDYFLDDPALDALGSDAGGAADLAALAAALEEVANPRAIDALFNRDAAPAVCLLLTAAIDAAGFDALERRLRAAALAELARPMTRTRFVRVAAHPDRSSAMRSAMERAGVLTLPAVVALRRGALVDAVECGERAGSGSWGQFGLLDVSADKLDAWMAHCGLVGAAGAASANGGYGGEGDLGGEDEEEEDDDSADGVGSGWACGDPACGNPVPHQHVTAGFFKDASNLDDFLTPL